MDLYLKILELGLDAKTWTDYLVQQTREGMHQEPEGSNLPEIAAGVERLGEKVDALKKLLSDYMAPPTAPVSGPRQYATLAAAQSAFRVDEGFPSDTLLGKYYAVGTAGDGYDIQFFTREMRERTQRDRPEWQIIELKK